MLLTSSKVPLRSRCLSNDLPKLYLVFCNDLFLLCGGDFRSRARQRTRSCFTDVLPCEQWFHRLLHCSGREPFSRTWDVCSLRRRVTPLPINVTALSRRAAMFLSKTMRQRGNMDLHKIILSKCIPVFQCHAEFHVLVCKMKDLLKNKSNTLLIPMVRD